MIETFGNLPTEEKSPLCQGLKLFNEGEFFEAHEVWEDAWNAAPLPEPHTYSRKRFYQGLIQCAVSLEHMRRGNPRGALRVFESAQTKFVGCPPHYLGIDHETMRRALGAMVDQLRTLPAHVLEPRAGRGLPLPVDLNDAPKIRWVINNT